MTEQAMLDELKRILRYDGQLADAGIGAPENEALRGFLTDAVREVQRLSKYGFQLVSINVPSGTLHVDTEASDGIIYVRRAWWGSTSPTELELMNQADEMALSPFDSGTPTHFYPYGGLIRLYPIPNQAGVLTLEAIKGQSQFTDATASNEVVSIPRALHWAAVWIAASRWLTPYTELQIKAAGYIQMANNLIRDWRGDAVAFGHTSLREEQTIRKWEMQP